MLKYSCYMKVKLFVIILFLIVTVANTKLSPLTLDFTSYRNLQPIVVHPRIVKRILINECKRYKNNKRVNWRLGIAIVCQESRFKRTAKSIKNCLGLMQVHTNSVKDYNRKYGTSYAFSDMTNDIHRNIEVGVYKMNSCASRYSNYFDILNAYEGGEYRKVKRKSREYPDAVFGLMRRWKTYWEAL